MTTKKPKTRLKKGTIPYEVEKVRLQIARILLQGIKDRVLSPLELKTIASDVLSFTSTVSKHKQLDDAVHELATKHPLLYGVKMDRLSKGRRS